MSTPTPFDPPAMVVKEAFGEISIPLLKDMPFAHELTLDAVDGRGRELVHRGHAVEPTGRLTRRHSTHPAAWSC